MNQWFLFALRLRFTGSRVKCKRKNMKTIPFLASALAFAFAFALRWLTRAGADQEGGCRGSAPPPPPPEMTCGFLTQLEFPEKTRHQSATTFLSGAPLPPKKNAGSAPDVYFLAFALMFGFAFASYVRAGRIKSL